MKFLKNYSLPLIMLGGLVYLVFMLITLPKSMTQQAQQNVPQGDEFIMPAPDPSTSTLAPAESAEMVDLEKQWDDIIEIDEKVTSSYKKSASSKKSATSSDKASDKAISVPSPIEGKEPVDYNQPQKLPSEPLVVNLAAGEVVHLEVEVATEPRELLTGLMYREEIPANTGMLFLFDEVKEHGFWMKNTFAPLDIIFITQEGLIHKIHENAVPGDLALVKSEGEVMAVLEIGGGEAAKLGLNKGDKIESTSFTDFVQSVFGQE